MEKDHQEADITQAEVIRQEAIILWKRIHSDNGQEASFSYIFQNLQVSYMSDMEIGQMRNGFGLSGNQLERYQTRSSIAIKKQANLVNGSALGSLVIEKGFQITVDKLLKELLKKEAGAVGGALGGAAAISGGVLIGMLLITEEDAESKIGLDELEREQEKKKEQENGSGNSSGGDKKGDSETVTTNKGNVIRDVDMINHGNSSTHPEWPNDHIVDWSKNSPKQK